MASRTTTSRTDGTPKTSPRQTQDSEPAQLLLGPMLRYVDGRSATIWVETDRPCIVGVLGSTAPTFTIHGRHYALVMVEELEPGTTLEYTVDLDGRRAWPEADSDLPPSIIRTPAPDDEISILAGSCRAAAPHEPPYTLELTFDDEGRGVDTLWAHARRMIHEPPTEWPDLLLLVGDQIYADDSSPGARARIDALRDDDFPLPPEIVATYEEYCWLYHEAWSLHLERWLLSTVPSAMIFDDHDMIDDWNISQSWVDDIRDEPWWSRHAIEGLMSYWVYQHLGNLSPDRIRTEKLLAAMEEAGDGTDLLSQWAARSEEFTPVAGGYRFSFVRRAGAVTVVIIDSRNARVLTDEQRLMVGPEEWKWVREQALAADGHLILASSLPVFIADGLHDLQQWNEQVCSGAWGSWAASVGESLRRHLDLEDWSAFSESYDQFLQLIDDLRSSPTPPSSIVVVSGDIHFSYVARVDVDRLLRATRTTPDVWQVVSSPTRNALIPPERGVLRATLTRPGAAAGRLLRRLVRNPDTAPRIELHAGPFFANNMSELHYRANGVWTTIEQSTTNDDGEPELHEVARVKMSGVGIEPYPGAPADRPTPTERHAIPTRDKQEDAS